MKAHKALRAILCLSILIIGFLLPVLTSNPVLAQSSSGQTILYFTDTLNNENISDLGFTPLSLIAPIKQNDSKYPPSVTSGDQWLTWLSYVLLEEINFSDYGEFGDFGDFGDFELFIPSPYRIVESYTYNGSDSIKINGDFFYNLYFESPQALQKSGDNLTVGFYSTNILGMPTLIESTTIELTPKEQIRSDIYQQQITLKNVNYTLKSGESLIFTIEIIPSNKTLSTVITQVLGFDRLENIANWLENRSKLVKIQDIGTKIKEIVTALKELNITSEDFTKVINSMISSSFVYDSINHPSSVTIPIRISEEDIRVYFLHANQKMNENRPETTNGSIELTETLTLWTNEPFDRNKILKVDTISANLYLDYYQFSNLRKGKFTITVTLYDDDTTIASSEKVFDSPNIFQINTKPKPATFTFSNPDWEITYGHTISIGVSLNNGADVTVNILFDSSDYPSALKVKLEETQNIKIKDITSNPSNGKIIPGETVEYTLNVTSEKADTLKISSIEREKIGDWEITIPETTSIFADSWTNIQVLIKSLSNLKEAYGNTIILDIIVNGNTGITRQEVFVEISQDAIQYDIEVLGYTNNINISKGENHTFFFVIKNNNTGAIDDVDSYTITATSQNHWSLITRDRITNLQKGDSTDADDARVVIYVPENTTLDSDNITITITSDGNPSASVTINVTVHVIGGDFVENIYNLFNSWAESLGMNEMFGSYGAIVLVGMLMVIILFLLIILALVFTTKHVRIICIDRIKEIDATEKATFELILQNPIKKTQSYEIYTQQTTPSSKWMIDVEPPTITISDRQSKTVQVIVTPANSNEPKDWTEVTVYVKKTGKKKTSSITLVTMIKEGKALLKLDNVSHWPTIFNQDEKVTTTCSISNDGTVSARNVKVFFYLNGKQKSKVEVTIPAGNIADLQIPWIAVKGKNKVRIRLKE